MNPSRLLVSGLAVSWLLLGSAARAQPVTSALTYQGELNLNGALGSGLHDLRFRLFTASGVRVGPELCANDVQVVQGRFTVALDFGAAFDGAQRFLEIDVRPDTGSDCADTSGFTTLAPRQALTSTPYASYALAAGAAATAANAAQLGGHPPSFFSDAANLTGTLPTSALSGVFLNRVEFLAGNNNFAGNEFVGQSFSGGGAGLTGLNASNLASGVVPDLRLSSNVALLTGTQSFSGAKTFADNGFLLRNTAGTFSTTLRAGATTAARSLVLPDVSGTIISTGNLSAITAAGTITSGVWQGSTIATSRGGTGADLSATGGAGQFVKQLTLAGPLSVAPIAAAELPATAGDLSGPYSGPSVVRIRGRALAATAPAEGQVLAWNGVTSQWEPALVDNVSLASDPLSLSRVSGGIMTATGTRIGINTAPAVGKELHVAGDAQFDGAVTIGAQTRYYSIGGFEFRNLSNTSTLGVSLQESTAAGGLTCQAVAAVHLPQGATITSILARWTDTSVNSCNVKLDRWPLDGVATGTTLVEVDSFGSSGATGSQSGVITNPVVDNSAYLYLVRATWTTTATGNIILESVRITYTVAAPLP